VPSRIRRGREFRESLQVGVNETENFICGKNIRNCKFVISDCGLY